MSQISEHLPALYRESHDPKVPQRSVSDVHCHKHKEHLYREIKQLPDEKKEGRIASSIELDGLSLNEEVKESEDQEFQIVGALSSILSQPPIICPSFGFGNN